MKSDIKSLTMLFPHTTTNYVNVTGNVSIFGNEFRSYNVPIARKTGDKIAQVTSRKYSVTTSKHTNSVLKSLENSGFTVQRTDF